MKVYSVAKVRARLAEALDAAERGTAVTIERKGVRYRLALEPRRKRLPRAVPLLEVVDRTLLEQGWTWEIGADGQLGLAGSRAPGRAAPAHRRPAPRGRR